MKVTRKFQDNLTDLVVTSLYNYNYAKNNKDVESVDFDKLKQEAFDEYAGKYDFNSTKLRYPHLNYFTNTIVGVVLQEIENLPNHESPLEEALRLSEELISLGNIALAQLSFTHPETTKKLTDKLTKF